MYVAVMGHLGEDLFQLIEPYLPLYLKDTVGSRFFLLLLFTCIFGGLALLLRFLGAKLQKDAKRFLLMSFKGFKLQEKEILSSDHLTLFFAKLIRALQILGYGCVGILYLTLVLGLFPATATAADYFWNEIYSVFRTVLLGIWNYLPNIGYIAIIGVVSFYVVRFFQLIFKGLEQEQIVIKGFYPEWAGTTFNIVRLAIWAMTLIMIFPYLPGSSSPAFKGISIFFGVLVSLGSTVMVGNMIAGIALTYTRAFQNADRVEISGVQGKVLEKTLFVTRLRTTKNEEVAIPNLNVMGKHIVNYTARANMQGIALHTTVSIGYDVDWREVNRLLLEAAANTDYIADSPEAYVLQISLDDFYVTYELNAFTRSASLMPQIYSQLHANILDSFRGADVEILSPHFTARMVKEIDPS